jgi:hypothetical protein
MRFCGNQAIDNGWSSFSPQLLHHRSTLSIRVIQHFLHSEIHWQARLPKRVLCFLREGLAGVILYRIPRRFHQNPHKPDLNCRLPAACRHQEYGWKVAPSNRLVAADARRRRRTASASAAIELLSRANLGRAAGSRSIVGQTRRDGLQTARARWTGSRR